MKKLVFILSVAMVLGLVALGNATLITIGQASYGGNDYNLIWDDDNNGNSIVWLDYTNSDSSWSAQKSWAEGLDPFLMINLLTGYHIDWGTNDWRLPNSLDTYLSNTGYNITTSEMGHLFYIELGNLGLYDELGNFPQTGYGFNNTGDFNNLLPSTYWSTEFTAMPSVENAAFFFTFSTGDQGLRNMDKPGLGLAVRTGTVTYNSPSPVPGPPAIWLLGSGLIGLAAVRRKLKK